MKPIQIKDINRSQTQPIFFKEKILENGEIKRIIYQRKNIESIDGLFKKIEAKIRYTTQDFAMKFDLTILNKALGFKSLKILIEGDESKKELQDFKSSVSTTGADGIQLGKMRTYLKSKFVQIDDQTEFEINFEKYDNNEFLRDFQSVVESLRNERHNEDTRNAFTLFESSINSNLLTRNEMKWINRGFQNMKKVIEDYLKDAPENTKDRFIRKLDEVRNQSMTSKPTDKQMKNSCVVYLETYDNSYGQMQDSKTPKPDAEILNSIEQFFSSTSTEDEKKVAQGSLQEYFKEHRASLPIHVEMKIFPEEPGFYETYFAPRAVVDSNNDRTFIVNRTKVIIPKPN
jgi:hypothetical protein